MNSARPFSVLGLLSFDSYWRSLLYFNVYRVLVAGILLGAALAFGTSSSFGSYSLPLFVYVSSGYLAAAALLFVPISIHRPIFDVQLTFGVAMDVGFVAILMYASGGIDSGLGLLLMPSLVISSLITRGRLALFHAALASIAVLLEQTYQVLRQDVGITQHIQAGLLSVGYFATAWLAYALAQYAAASEELAAQREIDLANMAEVSELVIQDMQDGVLVVDGGGVVRQHNAQAEVLLGGLPAQEQEMLLRSYAPALARRFEEWRRQDRVSGEPLRGANPGRLLQARFVPVGQTRERGAVIFLEDLTRVQSQAQQMKLAALGRLTANIAHEVRNPLSAITHATELLQEEPALAETPRLLQIIRDNAERLEQIIQDVMKLNRQDRAHRESFGLEQYLRTFVEQFAEIEAIPRDTILLRVTPDIRISFDQSHLNQVMWNLCRNALRHCHKREGSIRIASRSMPNGAQLDVVDDGEGIPEDHRGQLFEPFFTTVASGTGLGLYISRELCSANGAALDYVETLTGTQFTITCRRE